MKRDPFDMRMPLFIKLWFGLVAFFAICVFVSAFYALGNIVAAGPEGIGREIGTFIKAVKDGSQ